jgi:hypothetical protein
MFKTLLAFGVGLAATGWSSGQQVLGATIDISKSSLTIVTEKEGLASGLAHRHIIAAAKWTSTLDLKVDSTGAIEGGTATVSIPAAALIVDSPEAAKPIMGLLKEGKIWDSEKDSLSPKNADDVKENMIVESQLYVAKYPLIEGRGTLKSCQKSSASDTICSLDLTVKVRDQSVTKNVAVLIRSENSGQVAEFISRFKFTDFGIKPYTAMLGAIAVSDEFVLATRLVSQ